MAEHRGGPLFFGWTTATLALDPDGNLDGIVDPDGTCLGVTR